MPPPPWAALPPHLSYLLRPALPSVADEIIVAIRQEISDYRRPLTGDFGRNVRGGVEYALGRFLDLFGDAEREPAGNREVYVQLGRGEYGQGRSLDALLSAYRLGARVAWRRFVEAGRAGDADPDQLFLLGEAMFAYIDELSAESTEGYAAAQSEAAGERARERRRLVRQLLQVPPPAEDVVRAQAERAGWPLPDTVAVLVAPGGDADQLAGRLGTGTIAAAEDSVVVALVPDPDAPGRRAQMAAAVHHGSLGPTVQWSQVPTSAARARLGLRLAQPGELLVTDERLGELVLRADPQLSSDLAAAVLSPLQALTPKQATKLTDTLRAWLDHQGRIDAVAAALDVHPQTVRYRVNQLREHVALDDPDTRFELGLALRAAQQT